MGQAGSSLVDYASDGDIQSLKTALQERQQHLARSKASAATSVSGDEQWLAEVEEAAHAVVSTEVHSAQQFQQLQIALELLLQAKPDAWASSVANSVGWTGAHRACVTGNLSFLSFVFQRYDAHDVQERDAFGLFPVDLVPPELLRASEDMARDAAQEPRVGGNDPIFPATARARRNLALQILRQKKNEAQARCIDQFLFREHASQLSLSSSSSKASPEQSKASASKQSNQEESNTTDTSENTASLLNCERANEPLDNQSIEADPRTAVAASAHHTRAHLTASGAYFIAFEPSCEHIVANNAAGTIGAVHDRSTPLRLKYRFPRIDEFLNGYFQLIWRENEPRSEEPHYGAHVLMRDEMFHESALNVQELAKEANVGATRRMSSVRCIEEENPVLQGCFPFDVSHLPYDSVCNVLFVASDKHLMKRTVVLSTEGIALRDANDGYDFLDPRNNGVGYDEDGNDLDSDDESEDDSRFVFHVAGEAFSHPNPAFADKVFAGIDDFELFVKTLRANSNSRMQQARSGLAEGGADGAAGDSEAAVECGGKSSSALPVCEAKEERRDAETDSGAVANERRAPEPIDTSVQEETHDNQNEHEDEEVVRQISESN